MRVQKKALKLNGHRSYVPTVTRAGKSFLIAQSFSTRRIKTSNTNCDGWVGRGESFLSVMMKFMNI